MKNILHHGQQVINHNQNLGKKSVVTRAPVRKSVAAVSMFMPAQVATTYGANYTDTGMGVCW